jgi:cellulose synthase/poly-beta-1,6-N-acetylglucosamine synthase-like glycosyltransferase
VAPSELPYILVVVPVFDEAALISGKLVNLCQLTYPIERRTVVIVDGGSIDGTLDQVDRFIGASTGLELLRTTCSNKTAQVAAALRAYPQAEWVLMTDADAMLPADIIERLFSAAVSDSNVGVVGAAVRPTGAHRLEQLHWQFADWLRERECRSGSSGLVAAPCYLARREFLVNMPLDTIADDVHVACRAMVAGRRVRFLPSAVVQELRSPRTLLTLLAHKHRKAGAYLREIFRFLPQAGQMRNPMRGIFVRRAALLIAGPAASVTAGVWLLMTARDMTFGVAQVLALLLVLLAFVSAKRGRDAGSMLALAIVLAATAFVALLTYPFSRQTASFAKVLPPSELDFRVEPE